MFALLIALHIRAVHVVNRWNRITLAVAQVKTLVFTPCLKGENGKGGVVYQSSGTLCVSKAEILLLTVSVSLSFLIFRWKPLPPQILDFGKLLQVWNRLHCLQLPSCQSSTSPRRDFGPPVFPMKNYRGFLLDIRLLTKWYTLHLLQSVVRLLWISMKIAFGPKYYWYFVCPFL